MVSYPRMKRFLRRFVARLAFVAALLPLVPAFGADYSAARVISVNIRGGSTADVATDSAGLVAVPAKAWNNYQTLNTNYTDAVTWDGVTTVTLSPNWTVNPSGTTIYWYLPTGIESILRTYIDDKADKHAQMIFSNLPFAVYDVYVYMASDGEAQFSPVSTIINGVTTSYTCGEDGIAVRGADGWGQSQQLKSKAGTNVIIIKNQTAANITIDGGTRGTTRGGVAAIQLVESNYTATLSGDVAFSKITTWQPGRPTTFPENSRITITNAADAVLTVDESVSVHVLKFVNSSKKLTLKYTSSSKLLAAQNTDFSKAEGKVAFDCTGLSDTKSVTLMSGALSGIENIDVAGSSLPAGGALIVTKDAVKLSVAQWTRGAGTDVITDANNWLNKYVPYKDGVFTDEFSLAADADWSAVTISDMNAKTINLNGHRLTLSSLAGTGLITDSSADPTAPGAFVARVASDTIWQNAGVTLSGNLKFVKEGAGTFVGSVQDQLYTGGTVVNEGSVQSSDSEKYLFYGARGSTVTVNEKGTLDVNGKYDWYVHDIVLNGGTLANSGDHQTKYTWKGLGNVTLTADSKMALQYHILFCDDYATLNLNGHTLTVSRTSGKDGVLCSFGGNSETHYTITGGTLVTGVGIRLNTRAAGVDLTDANLAVSGTWLHNATTFVVADLEENLTSSESSAVAEATGRFKTNGKFDNVRLLDGATLDLRATSGTFSTASKLKGYNLTFADNAAITVDLTGRTGLTQDMKIVSWTDATKPPESATFTAKGSHYNVVRKDDGLYLDRGVITIFR